MKRYGQTLEALGELLQCYSATQAHYNSYIHEPDYLAFSQFWEESLYAPMRKEVEAVSKAAASHPHLIYCAPGARAPLLRHDKDVCLASSFGRITLLDIDQNALNSARSIINVQSPHHDVRVRPVDFSGLMGQRLCDLFYNVLKSATSPEDVASRLSNFAQITKSLFFNARENLSALSEEVGNPACQNEAQLCVSEMMASFTGTAVFLAFRSSLFRKFGSADKCVLDSVLHFATELWREHNRTFLANHLEIIRSWLNAGDVLIIAFDSLKVFDDPRLNPVHSFGTNESFARVIGSSRFQIMRHSNIHWRDHPVDFETAVYGVAVNDFKAHTHVVQIYALTVK